MRALSGWFRFVILIAAAVVPLEAQNGGGEHAFQILPPRHLVHDFVADGVAHRFSVTQVLSGNDVQVSVGGILPLINCALWDIPVQISTGASIQARLDPGQSIAVQSSEFAVDFFLLDAQLNHDLMIRTGLMHSSHHLGDGFNGDSNMVPIDYSRDEVQLYVIHPVPLLQGQMYAGARYAYNLVIRRPNDKRFTVHAGLHTRIRLMSQNIFLFAAGDIKMRQELANGTSQRVEAGLEYENGGGRIIRLALSYSGGFDERGQFFGKRRSEAGAGIVIVL